MQRLYIIPAAVIGLGLAGGDALADTARDSQVIRTSVTKDADGNYHKKETATGTRRDATGTVTSFQTKDEVTTDADGNAERKVITQSSTDPKGLMNKSKTVTTDATTYKDGQVERSYKKTVNGEVVEKTSAHTSASAE